MSDQELQLELAKMLPDKMWIYDKCFTWRPDDRKILDTEWLHVVWLVEQTLTPEQRDDYFYTHLCGTDKELDHAWVVSASWQQRAEALVKVKGMKHE